MNGKSLATQQAAVAPPVNSGLLQRQCGTCGQHTIAGGECEECCQGGDVPAVVHDVLASPGEPLDPAARSFFEPRFRSDFSGIPVQLSSSPVRDLKLGRKGDESETAADRAADRALASEPSQTTQADFSRVFIHRDARAAEAARLVGARAFTVGTHIVFGEGEYRPTLFSGKRLLAHELAHVVQQTGPIIRRKTGDGSAAPTPATDASDRQPSDPAPPEDKQLAAPDPQKKPREGQLQAGPKDAPAADLKDKAKPAPALDKASPEGPQAVGDLSTGDLALVDTELAEHQRWGAASKMVGAAESGERAEFIAKKGADSSSFASSAGQGAAMAVGIKIAEKVLGKVVLKLAVKRLGASAVKFTPVPGVGAMIGGAIAGYELATRNWKETGETIGKFGKGASFYDKLANDVEAISTVLDVATQVLNLIGGIIGAISFGMWAVTIATVGVASPLAFTLSAIAGAIGLVALVLDGINALVLKELVTVFRILDTFTSEADPREVVAEGNAVSQSAGAATGFLGGLAGAHAVEAGSKRFGGGNKKPPAPPPEHTTPPPATGEGPSVKAVPPAEGAPLAESKPVESKPVIAEPAKQAEAPAVPEAQTPAAEVKSPPVEAAAPVPAEVQSKAEPSKPKGRKAAAKEPLAPEPQVSEIEQARLEEIKEKRQMAKGGGLVDDDFAVGSSEKKKPTQRKGERVPGRSEVPERVKASQRERARKAFGKKMQEALLDPGKHDALTQKTLEHLTVEQQDYIIEKGKLPPEIEFHHLMTIADFPEMGHRPDVGIGLPKDVHKQAGHGGDTTRPVEAGTFVDPAAEHGGPSFNEDPEAVKGKRAATKERIAEGTAASTEKQGGIDRDLIVEREQRLKQLKAKARLKPGADLDAKIKQTEKEIQTIKDLVAKKAAPLVAPSSPEPVAPPQPGPVVEPQAAPDPGAPQEPALQADIDAVPPEKRIRVADEEPPPPDKRIRVAAEPPQEEPAPLQDDAAAEVEAQAEQEAAEGEPTKQPRKSLYVPNLPPSGGPKTSKSDEQRNDPIVRHVNPGYAVPPCSPEQITEVAKDILQILDARAEAERVSAAMAAQEKHHKDNQKPIGDMAKGTEQQISATEAHQQAVQRRAEANGKKKENEGKVQTKLESYSERAGKLAAIKVPMSGFKRFTGLAYSLPDDPGILLSVKRGLIKMNKDTTNFLNQLDQMDAAIAAQQDGKGDRDKGIEADGKTLTATKDKAEDSKTTFGECKEKTEDLDQENQSKLEDATKLRSSADQNASALAADAEQKKAKKESMAAALQTWAQNHKKARKDALELTRKNMEAQGYRVTEVKEL